MQDTGLVPVFNHHDTEVAKKVLDASYRAGIRVFEFTNRGENAAVVFAELVRHCGQYPDLILGIGTIFSKEQAAQFCDAGAQFVVSPAFIPEVAQFANEQNLIWIPGCGTVTEIYNALQLGAQIVKVFPGNVLGPGFVKSVRAVLPNVLIMPTGGVTPTTESLSSWFGAGVDFVGMGSQLYKKELLEKEAYDALEKNIKEALSIIKDIY